MKQTISMSLLLGFALAFLVGCGPGDKSCPGGSCEVLQEASKEPAGRQEPTATDAGSPGDAGRPVDRVSPPACDAGSESCRCQASGKCGAGLRCEAGICKGCPKGSAGCGCKSGGSCDKGLSCDAGVCKGCEGKANCACYANNSCDTGHRCELKSDGSATCIACGAKGGADCNCQRDDECQAAFGCINRRCRDLSALKQIPTAPKCYTPCEGNAKDAAGNALPCHPTHRLRAGCLAHQVCAAGSCVAKEQASKLSSQSYPFCMKPADCPMWQGCIQGRCYSNCSASSECPSGMVCHAYVCRRPCELGKASCGPEESCFNAGSTDDKGVCMPLASRRLNTPPRKQTTQHFQLSTSALSLDSLQKVGYFAILNNSPFPVAITLVKESDTTGQKTPLSWLSFDLCKSYKDAARSGCASFANAPKSGPSFGLTLPGKAKVIVRVLGAQKPASAYSGMIRIKSAETTQRLTLAYRPSSAGRWKGKFYSFGNFDDTHIQKLTDKSLQISTLKNAFLRRWVNFKRNEIGLSKLRALLQSLQSRTWSQEAVSTACRRLFSTQSSEDVACYPYASSRGYEVLSISRREASVPSGVTALDFSIYVKELSGNRWQGRIETDSTLHYPGNPRIDIGFGAALGSGPRIAVVSGAARADIGGRIPSTKDGTCASARFQKVALPWLLPDFVAGSYARSGSLLRERFACRAWAAPHSIPDGADAKQKEAIKQANLSLSAANPVPNGRTLRRRLELLDGVLLDGRIFFAIVRESFTSPFTQAGGSSSLAKELVRYGYLWLQHSGGEFQDAHTAGSVQPTCSSDASCDASETCQAGVCQPATDSQQVSCSSAIVKQAVNRDLASLKALGQWSPQQLADLVSGLLGAQSQQTSSNAALQITRSVVGGKPEYSYTHSGKKHYIHYFCEDTRQLNGGPANDPRDCPPGSKVVFFESSISEADMRGHTCQSDPSAPSTCDARLAALSTTKDFRRDVAWKCEDANEVLCDANRKDLREGKIFFKAGSSTQFVSKLAPLESALSEAFRYRYKFQTRDGKGIGFTPSLCSKTAPSQTPYCYDPKVIEQIEQRVNCLEAIYTDATLRARLPTPSRAKLKAFLIQAFAYHNRTSNGAIATEPGFEMLLAQLKVMLGDEAYTRALTSRYQLAAQSQQTFEGDLLEPNGVRLSGVLGYEMVQLYTSVQYYQAVLDRFYAQTDAFAASFESSSTAFLTAGTASSYVPRLLWAAARKARSWSQIAKKYHQLRRRDLAKAVLERAYLSTYTEQLLLTQLLHKLGAVIDRTQRAQLRAKIDEIMLTYNAALLDMQETHQKVRQQLDAFGFPEGYIPFPALSRPIVEGGGTNAFILALQFAKQKLAMADAKEQLALQSRRSFDTQAASFQSELVKTRQNYDGQLIELCGGLPYQGSTVPATAQNAHLDPKTRGRDICGRLPGSAIYEAFVALEKMAVSKLQTAHQYDGLLARIDAEKARIQKTCSDAFSLADITWKHHDERRTLQLSVQESRARQQSITRLSTGLMQIATGWKCEVLFGGAASTSCANQAISNGARIALLARQELVLKKLNAELLSAKTELTGLQRDFSRVQYQMQCDVCPPSEPNCKTPGVARIQSQAYISQLALDALSFKMQSLQDEYDMRLALARIKSLQQTAARLQQEKAESLALLTQVQAAQNDPNTRIYKNDAILSAERTFDEAMREAYRTTLIYEYYTGQSYAKKGELFLIRMVSAGDKNLEAYLSQLEQAFRDFEEQNGKPDIRVLVLSLKDHILRIPRADAKGQPLDTQARIRRLQEALHDPKNYDRHGYLSIPFAINVGVKDAYVSPITYNHKISFVEVDIKTTDGGDDIGRVYLQQGGTGVLRQADQRYRYYSLPRRTAVLNAFFNGLKKSSTLETAIYRNYRLQDRPLGNTRWLLQLNQATEIANQDISLNAINDIVLYIYYTDFTRR